MALTIGATTYEGNQPTATGQILTSLQQAEYATGFKGSVTITLDGSTTSGTINFIDGTNGIFFTLAQSNSTINPGSQANPAATAVAPKGVMATIAGGTETAYVGISVNTVTATGFNFVLSAAGTSALTVVVGFMVLE